MSTPTLTVAPGDTSNLDGNERIGLNLTTKIDRTAPGECRGVERGDRKRGRCHLCDA